MYALSRDISPPEILADFFARRFQPADLYLNDVRVCAAVSTIFKWPEGENFILDLDFLERRRALDLGEKKKKEKKKKKRKTND